MKQREAGRQQIAVYGASGHTGRFVVAELRRRGVPVVAAGRDITRLLDCGFDGEAVGIRAALIDDPAALISAFSGCAAVINCAGPFLDTALPVAQAALAAGAHYLDITAEQASAWNVLQQMDRPARRAGVTAVPAAGFFGGLADLVVAAGLGTAREADTIDIAIMLDSWHPTEGTRRTGARNTAVRQVVSGGKLVPLPQPAPEREWDFPAPWHRKSVTALPFSEIPLITQCVKAGELHTWLSQVALDDIRNAATPPPVPVDASGRSAQRFLVEAAIGRHGGQLRISVSGQDIYAVTAPLVCEAASRVLASPPPRGGAYAPSALFDGAAFLRALAPQHLSLTGLPD
jgi:short subunit dehydrogenase-like uncharacterized protein